MNLEIIKSLLRNKWILPALVAIAILIFTLANYGTEEKELKAFGIYSPAVVKEVFQEKGGKYVSVYYAKAWFEVSGHRYFLKTRLQASNINDLYYPNSMRTPKQGDTLLVIYSSRNPWINRLEKLLPENNVLR